MTDRRLAAADGGQMFLLAGLVLALSLVALTVVTNQDVHSPARESTRPSQAALGTYDDFKAAVREAVRFHLTSVGITDDAFAQAFRELGDRRRLGLAGRDVDPIVRLNGTRESRLCGGSPPYGNASLAGIASVQSVGDDSSCSNAANGDGILEDGRDNVVGAAVDVGLTGPRYRVEETIVVTAIQQRYFLRDAVNASIGAEVRDPAEATDRSDGVVHRVRAPRPNVAAVKGYASVPHSLHSGSEDAGADRNATWRVVVANPSGDRLDVDRVEIVDAAGEAPWSTALDAVVPLHPATGWGIEQDPTVTPKIVNPEFDDGLAGWDDANRSVGEAGYGVADDEPGCRDLRPDNRCLKLETEVEADGSDGGTVRSYYYANQSFVAPSDFDEARITYSYNMSADLTVDENLLNVSLVDGSGRFAYGWESSSMTSLGWATREEQITTDLVPGRRYTLSVHADQTVCDPDDSLDCGAVTDHRAVTWVDGIRVDFTRVGDQTLVWDGTGDVAVDPGTGVNFTALVRTAEWSDALSGGADLRFETRVRASDDGGATYGWYELSDPSVPDLDRALDSHRGSTDPTVSLRLAGGDVAVPSATPSNVTVVVEEGSDAASVPGHDLRILVPTDFGLVDHGSSGCAGGVPCYRLTGASSVARGTLLTFRSPATGFDAGRRAALNLTLDPPGVGTPTAYRLPMELDPAAGDVPNATADGIVTVEPRSSSPHTLEMVYHSEPTTDRLDREAFVGMAVGVEMSANQAMNVTVQVWNHSRTGRWAWRTLRSGVVGYAGVSWSMGWRNVSSEEALGVMDEEGRSLAPPLPDGSPPPEGTVAIRFLHDDLDSYRLDVDLAYWRAEHV